MPRPADAGLGEARPLLTAEELPPEALPESALYLAETYEAVCGGSPHPEKDPDLYDPSWIYLGYGLLRREGLVDEWLEQKKQSYPNSNYVVFTLYESAVLAQPFFVDPPPIQPLPLSENGESFGSIAEDYRMQTSRLRLERLTRTEDGLPVGRVCAHRRGWRLFGQDNLSFRTGWAGGAARRNFGGRFSAGQTDLADQGGPARRAGRFPSKANARPDPTRRPRPGEQDRGDQHRPGACRDGGRGQ